MDFSPPNLVGIVRAKADRRHDAMKFAFPINVKKGMCKAWRQFRAHSHPFACHHGSRAPAHVSHPAGVDEIEYPRRQLRIYSEREVCDSHVASVAHDDVVRLDLCNEGLEFVAVEVVEPRTLGAQLRDDWVFRDALFARGE